MKNKAVILCFTILCVILLCNACSWVNDDLSDCPTGCWIKLSYTYNMLNVDAATKQVKDATIFIFDRDNKCIARQEIDSLVLHQNDSCMVKLPPLPAGEYTFLVWAGLADANYQYTPSALLLLRNEVGEQANRISGLFHGRLDNVQISDEYSVFEIPLVKNTNSLSCILQSQSNTLLDANEFTLKLTSCNGLMNHQNHPCDSIPTCYLPYFQETVEMEGLQVVHMGMNTLRLMEKDDTQLTLCHNSSGCQIFNIPLSQYLLLSQQAHAATMTAQEYLDRQDQYNLIFFLTSTPDPLKPYVCLSMQVNNWMVRMSEVDLKN